MSKKCPKCGTEFNDDMKFCTKCGAKYEETPTPKKKKSPALIITAVVLAAAILFGGGFALAKDPLSLFDGKSSSSEKEDDEKDETTDEENNDDYGEAGTGAVEVDAAVDISNMTFNLATGGESGTYYGFGSVLAQHAANNAGVNITAVSSGGSQDNINRLQNFEADFAFCQSDVMTYAYSGTNIFAETGCVDGFSAVAALYTDQVQIVTCNPDIKSVADLKGKSVSVGDAGSGTYFNAMDILGVYGLTEMDIQPTYQSFGDSLDALMNGTIDAAFVVAGAPVTLVTDLIARTGEGKVSLVSLDDEHIAGLMAKSPYYCSCTIPADTYNMTSDVKTVGIGAVLLARNDVPEEAVYAFVKDIFDNSPNLTDVHAKYSEISLEYGSSITSVPYHPGAVRYFAENGINVY